SLGCRLALEAIGLLRAGSAGLPPVAVRRVCLMAAAVPQEFVEGDGRYAALLRALLADQVEVRVLHSRSDPVLHFAFPLGQAIAGEPSRAALGFDGPPPGMPGLGANVSAQRIGNASHSDYWGHEASEAAEAAARDAGEFLALGAHEREAGAARQVAEARRPARERAVGDPREVGIPEGLYA